jgi:predicted nuclease of restriction endonuclease-like (RecB) superfamily
LRGRSSAHRDYDGVLSGVVKLLEAARRAAARSVNALMTAAYWEIGRRIVEHEQGGEKRAGYGEALLVRLSADLTSRFGRGFGLSHLRWMRQFFLTYPDLKIRQSLIGEFSPDTSAPIQARKDQSAIGETSPLVRLANAFPLSWTHYVQLLHVRNPQAREFYEAEALRGGWSVRQLDRQISTQFYERTALSRNKAAMLTKGAKAKPEDRVSAEEEIKDPFVLEFLGLKDEYSETHLEDALIQHLQTFLLEMGGALTFVGRQRRLRIDHTWYRVDLLFFHRRLRCLLVIDLKIGPLTHADIGQMHLYLNYARAHWTEPGENHPVGLILCTERGESLARYALDGLPNKMVVREYLTALPDEKLLAAEITKTRKRLEGRR